MLKQVLKRCWQWLWRWALRPQPERARVVAAILNNLAWFEKQQGVWFDSYQGDRIMVGGPSKHLSPQTWQRWTSATEKWRAQIRPRHGMWASVLCELAQERTSWSGGLGDFEELLTELKREGLIQCSGDAKNRLWFLTNKGWKECRLQAPRFVVPRSRPPHPISTPVPVHQP